MSELAVLGLSLSIAWILLKMVRPTGVSCCRSIGDWPVRRMNGRRISRVLGLGVEKCGHFAPVTHLVHLQVIWNILELRRMVVDIWMMMQVLASQVSTANKALQSIEGHLGRRCRGQLTLYVDGDWQKGVLLSWSSMSDRIEFDRYRDGSGVSVCKRESALARPG